MEGPGITSDVIVRPAGSADAELLLAWRNDPDVRAWSRASDPIDRESHAEWLARALADPDRHVLLILTAAGGLPVATTRYDLVPSHGTGKGRERWEISIAVAPEMRGRGLGGATLRASDAWLLAAEPAAVDLVAWIRPTNVASRQLFQRNGYRPAPSPDVDMTCLVKPRRTEE